MATALDTSVTVHRVLHVINGEHYAGAERVQDLLAQHLPPLGFPIGFASLKRGRFAAARRAQNAPLAEFPMPSRLDLRPAWKLARMIGRDRYALVHAHTPRSLWIGGLAARLAGVPLIYHVHSPTARDTTDRLRNRLNTQCERWSLRQAARLIAVSPSLRDQWIADGIDPGRVVHVPNGVPSMPWDPSRCRPEHEWTLGTMALFRPRKGLEVLLEALAACRAAGNALRLRAVGPFETPAYRQAVMRLADRLHLNQAIDWIGFRNEIQAEFAKFDLFVLPSLFGEGLPMVLLEAMAAGLPIVATCVEGIPTAIRDGQEGVLAPPRDAPALAEAIQRIVHGRLDWATLRQNAYRRHAEQFSAQAMAHGVAAVYREILG